MIIEHQLKNSSPMENSPIGIAQNCNDFLLVWTASGNVQSEMIYSTALKKIVTNLVLREGSKKNPLNLWSWSYLAGPPPPSFLKTVIALRFFFCDVFWLIGWFRYVLKHILGMFKTHFGYGRLKKKTHWNCDHGHTLPE